MPRPGPEEEKMTNSYDFASIAKMIDHSLLNPTLTASDLEQGIQLALTYNVASVCILPYFLKRCAGALRGSTVRASTTIGFPHGGHTTAVKLAEARQAFEKSLSLNPNSGWAKQQLSKTPAK